jgi:hypothetical protein
MLWLGSSSAVSLAGIQIEFDYTYDSEGFFSDPVRRASLEKAGNILNRYVDDLDAVIPEGENSWVAFFNPPDSANSLFIRDIPIPENVVRIYVGGRSIPGRLAQALDLGAVGMGDPEWVATVENRGQLGASLDPATDFGPMGGSITFNSNLNEVPWHFEQSTIGLNSNEFDFITVAMHEVLHLLGIGIANAFDDLVDPQRRFTGPQALAVGSPTNPTLELDEFEFHWKSGTRSTWNGRLQEALLAPGIFPGRRAFPTLLDRAAMRDIGWDEARPGDANRDRLFNSTDLLTVFQAGLYETQQLAGWADGDWNDTGTFESGDLIEALQTGLYEQPAPAVSAFLVGDEDDASHAEAIVWYDTTTGALEVESRRGPFTAFEVRSTQELLIRDEASGFDGPFDVQRADKLFLLGLGGFDRLELGNVLPPNMDLHELQDDLTFDGAWLSGGGPTEFELRLVPEPSGITLLLLGTLGLARSRFARRP